MYMYDIYIYIIYIYILYVCVCVCVCVSFYIYICPGREGERERERERERVNHTVCMLWQLHLSSFARTPVDWGARVLSPHSDLTEKGSGPRVYRVSGVGFRVWGVWG